MVWTVWRLVVTTDLDVKQVELDRVPRVDVLVRVEELTSEQKCLVLIHSLFPERPAVVKPVHCQHNRSLTSSNFNRPAL